MLNLDAYRNRVEIGHGGMSTIYRATAPNGNLVALKVLAPHLANDPTALLRLEHESALGLVHPNIVRLVGVGEEKRVPFLVMDYVVGESLDRYLRRKGKMSAQQLAPILTGIAAALDYAHGRNVIHRDVKPGNILIRTDGQVLLNDFGVAKSDLGTNYTRTAARVGSTYYMSPEQALGWPDIKPASDIYSLGVTAYFALTGHHPFEAGNDIAIARMHVDTIPLHPSMVDPAVPYNVGDVVMQALQKDPNRRPRSAGAFAKAFSKASQRPRWHPTKPDNRPYYALIVILLCVFAAAVLFTLTGTLPALFSALFSPFIPPNSSMITPDASNSAQISTPTATQTATVTDTPEPTPTSTSTAAATATPKPTATRRPATPAPTSTPAPTRTPVQPTPDIPLIVTIESQSRNRPPGRRWYPPPNPRSTATPTPTRSWPWQTPTPTRTRTPRPTASQPTPAPTATLTLTPTATATATSTPLTPTVTLTSSIATQ